MHFQAQATSFLAKMMSVIFRPMLKMAVKCMSKDLEELKTAIEAEARSGAPECAATAQTK